MSESFTLTGVPSSFRAPLFAFEAVFGQGASSAASAPRAACYLSPILSSGNATAGQAYLITSEQQALELFGAGSPGHRLARMHIKVNPSGTFYIVGYAPSSGAGLASATATITWTASSITGVGVATFRLFGQLVDVGFAPGDTVTNLADILTAKVKSLQSAPASCANVSGVNTLTAKVPGASQNAVHRIQLVSITPGLGVSVAVSAALLAGGVDGAVTELTGINSALTSLNSLAFYYGGLASNVSAHVAAFKTHLVNKSLPIKGYRCRGFYAWTGSLSAGAALAIAQNYERMSGPWQRNSAHSPDEILAWYTAKIQAGEQLSSRTNFDNTSTEGFIQAAPFSSDWLDFEDDIGEGINDGLSPIQSTPFGAYLVMNVSTRSKDATGLLDDWRASEPHRVSVLDELGAELTTAYSQDFAGFVVKADPKKQDGSIDLDAIARFPAKATCPYLFTKWMKAKMLPYFQDGRLQGEDEWFGSLSVRIDPQNVSRIQASVSGRVIDQLHQATIRVAETTPN